MKKKLILSAVAMTLALAGCTTSPTPAPEPTPTQETLDLSSDIQVAALNMVWDDMSDADKESSCLLFNTDRDWAWEAFNAGAEDVFSKNTFLIFFNTHC